jgi:GntR family transcriptional regulator
MAPLATGGINPASYVPVYKQIEDLLKGAIRTGELRPFARVWSERKISETLNVSRMTARKAITNLIQEGYLFTQKGKGTFVSDSKIDQPVLRLKTFFDEMTELGMTPAAKVLDYGDIRCDGVRGKDLDVPRGTDILKIRRLMYGDDTPYCLEIKCIIRDKCRVLNESNHPEEDMIDVLTGRCYQCVVKFDIFIESTILTPEELELFGLKETVPGFCVKKYAFGNDGNKVSFTKCIYRGDIYRFRSTAEY